MVDIYLNSIIKQFEYYKKLGEETFSQLTDNELFVRPNEASNSVAIIVNHLAGNMLSRWTDFLTSDGEKEWRNRDQEFEDIIRTREGLILRWEEGWNCLFSAINSVNSSNINQDIFIRNQKHHISEAINRQMMHYAYHVGQIVYIGRMLKNESWTSLSIPKGKSKEFNEKKMKQGKHSGHFTDDLM